MCCKTGIARGLEISIYSALTSVIRIVSGPIVLLVISDRFSSEEIGFYYTFFSLVAMQQLAELGLGHTLKQYISHAYKVQDDIWCYKSKIKIKAYISFGFKWFCFVSTFIMFLVGPAGWYYYSDYTGSVDWSTPWVALIIVSALVTLLTPIQLAIDATQNQKQVFKAQFISSLIGTFSICIFVYAGCSLYTIALSTLLSSIVLYIVLYDRISHLYRELTALSSQDNTKDIFDELWPMLSKVSIVWGLGFLFWNGFNLIAFKIYDTEYAGKVIFTLVLARAGYNLAESIFSSQMTVIANKIATGHINEVIEYAGKYQKLSILVLTLGYFAFFFASIIFDKLLIFEKITEPEYTASIFAFFFSLLVLTTRTNLVRCFKVEPFVFVSIFHSISVPFSFYVFNAFSVTLYLYPCVFIIIVSIVLSHFISKKYLKVVED